MDDNPEIGLFEDTVERAAVDAETHARPEVRIEAPARVRRVAFKYRRGASAAREAREAFARWCAANLDNAPAELGGRFEYAVGGRRIVWEGHTEFATLTWIGALDDDEAQPADIGLEVFEGCATTSATRIDITAGPSISEAALAGFDPRSFCHSRVAIGEMMVATDFHLDRDGFVRYEVAAGGNGPRRVGVLTRLLLEIETYRHFALLGLFVARHASGRLASCEATVSEEVAAMGGEAGTGGNRQRLEALQELSVAVGQLMDQTAFRFAASKAYGEIVIRRLERLRETPEGDATSLSRYLLNRLEPALSTCAAVEKRQATLLERVGWAMRLLDTQIELDIEAKNEAVLASIDRTAQSQLRLQFTVEGLSTIAITYYALGILGYVVDGLKAYWHLDKTLVLALLALPVLLLVWAGIRSVRRRSGR